MKDISIEDTIVGIASILKVFKRQGHNVKEKEQLLARLKAKLKRKGIIK